MSDKRVKTVRLVWLEAFVETANTGSYKEAGRLLDLDPTVVAEYVRELQSWITRPLFHPSNRRPKLTLDGRDFLPKAIAVINILYTSRSFNWWSMEDARKLIEYKPSYLERRNSGPNPPDRD